VRRRIYWSQEHGSRAPIDEWLGIATGGYSPGVREMCCREAAHSSFRQAASDLARVGQIRVSHGTLQQIVERQGTAAAQALQLGQLRPDWSSEDCLTDDGKQTCVITGADGVKVPLVTEAEKAKRRRLRRRRGPKARRRRRRIGRGSDQPYKEFKIVAFYDPSKDHQYALGTSGDHRALGRLMRRAAGRVGLDQADVSYSVTDGADWIRNQYRQQLPMLAENVLDYYHLREHVIVASYRIFGEGSAEALSWREEMMGVVVEQGPLALLDRLGELRRALRSKPKREALGKLRNYVAKRMEMLDYPSFLARGLEIGSGPTEAFCKTLTARLKGPGMRWDKRNAEAMMALAAVRASGLWDRYWAAECRQVA
jgi:hypothetical protein